MAIVEAINIPIGVTGQETVQQAANSYEDLGDAVAKTQLEAERLAQQFGINDAKTQEAIKVAGKYKQQMEQLDFAIDAARGGTDQIFRATQGVVAGFEIAAGAAGLFGSESEELEKVLIKVQSAMALSQGLKDFQEFLPAIKNVSKSVTGSLTTAFKGFGKAARTAIASTGIGLLVVAVGALVAYWDDIKEAVSGVSEEQKKLLKDQELSVEASKKQLDDISAQENILRQQGKTEQEILNLKISATKNTITQLEAQIQQQKIIKEQQVETAQRNKDILSGILKFVEAPLYILLKGIDAALNAFGKESDLANQFADFGASLLFDPEEVASEADAAIAAQEKELQTMKNNLAGYEMSITKIRNDNYKKQQDDLKKAKDEEKRIEDDAAKKKEDAEIKRQKEEQDAIDDEEEMFNAWLEAEIARNEMAAANAEYVAKRKADAAEEEAKSKQAVADLEQKIFDESQALASAIINLVGQQSKIGKGIALAQIAADTAVALTSALKNSQSSTPDNIATGGLAGIAKYIGIATTILSNSKRAYDIIKAPAPTASLSGGGGGASAAAAAVPRFNAPTTRLPQTDEFTQVRRVYVTESDISNVQNKVKVTESLSQF